MCDYCMGRLLTSVYRGDPELEITLGLLRNYQISLKQPRTHVLVVLIEDLKEEFRENHQEEVMFETNIIGTTNDRARNLRDYVVFDTNAMNIKSLGLKSL